MNKKFLLVAAICAAMNVSGFAQENLAAGKTPEKIGTNVEGIDDLSGLTDGKYDDVYISPVNGTEIQSFQIDLGKIEEIGMVRITWEGARAMNETVSYSENGTDWTVYGTVENEETTLVDKFKKVVSARYIKFEGSGLRANGAWGVKMKEFEVFKNEAATLTTFTCENLFVNVGEPFTVQALDQYGENFAATYSLTNAKQVEGTTNQFTATAEGKVVLVADGKTITLNAVAKDESTYEAPMTDEAVHDGTQGVTVNGQISDPNWNQHYDKCAVFDFDDNKMLAVTNVGTFGVKNGNITGTGFTKLHFNIYSTKAVDDAYVTLEDNPSNLQKIEIKLKEGWNSVDLDVTGAIVFTSWVQLYLGTNGSAENPDILLDNVYFSKGSVEVVENVTVAKEPNARGFYAFTGIALKGETISNALSDKSIAAYDLTGLKLKSGVTYNIEPANPNALIYVAGGGGDDFKPTQDWGNTKNVVGGWNKSADNWYVPAKSVEYEDNGETPVYTKFFISAKDGRPLNYKRSIPAKSFVSTFLPINTTIPSGVKVYEFTEGANNNIVDLKEVETINQHTPYLLYNGNSDATEIKFTATGDVRILNGAGEGNEEKKTTLGDNVTVHGTYSYFTADAAKGIYALSGKSYDPETKTLKLAKVNGGKIVPFRVYFTLANTQAEAVAFALPGETTGINDINAENVAKAANIYSVDGRLVKKNATSLNGLESGIYIMNGKKYVVK